MRAFCLRPEPWSVRSLVLRLRFQEMLQQALTRCRGGSDDTSHRLGHEETRSLGGAGLLAGTRVQRAARRVTVMVVSRNPWVCAVGLFVAQPQPRTGRVRSPRASAKAQHPHPRRRCWQLQRHVRPSLRRRFSVHPAPRRSPGCPGLSPVLVWASRWGSCLPVRLGAGLRGCCPRGPRTPAWAPTGSGVHPFGVALRLQALPAATRHP